jgi:2-polyprenyl-3-methyl-5-hydroxy-6-metoxy-1,4-benzoquinol methylase
VNGALRQNEIPGFLRFERGADGRRNYPEVHGHFHWDPRTVRSRGEYTLAFFTNEHSACYILTRDQLRVAIGSHGYLTRPHQGRYGLPETAATDPYTQCGFQKLICISHLEEFLVHHLPNKYVGKFGVEDRELRRQVEVLRLIGRDRQPPASLFPTESRLARGQYSKNYYEPVGLETVSAIPNAARSVLSIGCGWGSVEGHLSEKGLCVCAVPLDPVIPGAAGAAGVEIISGDFNSARQQLVGRNFDCLLLSNVLHLVPDPVKALSSFAALLSDGGTAIAVAPNMARLPAAWESLRRDGAGSAALRSYETTGVHRVSRRILDGWFRSAGMKIVKVEKIVKLRRKSGTKVRRIASLLFGSWIADEFVVLARKQSETQPGYLIPDIRPWPRRSHF